VALPLPDPPLAGEEVALRPWSPLDAEVLVVGWNDPDVQRWTGVPTSREPAHARAWIEGEASRRSAHLSLDLVIAQPGDGSVLGEVGLARFDRVRLVAEVGYWLLPSGRGRGAAAAALGLLVPWSFAALGLDQVFARVQPDNERSIAVMRAAGFERRGLAADGHDVWSSRARQTQEP
jgi:RimJ/RimL family protein N-acetyltransferase